MRSALLALATGATAVAAGATCAARCGTEVGFVSPGSPDLFIKYDGVTLDVPHQCKELTCSQIQADLRAATAATAAASAANAATGAANAAGFTACQAQGALLAAQLASTDSALAILNARFDALEKKHTADLAALDAKHSADVAALAALKTASAAADAAHDAKLADAKKQLDFTHQKVEHYHPPTNFPTAAPTNSPTVAPTAAPTAAPTVSPTAAPTPPPTPQADPWTHVISTTDNNGVWAYDGSAWQSSSGFNNGDGMLASAYSTMRFTRMKVMMNGMAEIFQLKPQYANSMTLKELVHGSIKTNFLETKSWKNTKNNPWGLHRDGHEDWVCHEPSFNFRYYEGSGQHNYARIGFSMSEDGPDCGHPGTAEGVGLIETNHNPPDKLASGRLQWSTEANYFHAAEVFIDVAGGSSGWTRVIRTANNNAVWAYDGSAWESNGGWSNGNGMLASEYSTMKVREMMITMNGRTETFDVAPQYANSMTLKELVHGSIKTNFLETKSWKNTKTNPWGLHRDGHEDWVCHEPSFNFRYYEDKSSHNYARIGFSMSEDGPDCGHPGTAEGVGLIETNHNDKLASGRLQWASEANYFHEAEVFIR